MRFSNLSLLGLCITLAACQSHEPQEAVSAAPNVVLSDALIASENTQWLAPLPFLPGAERLQVGARSLQVVDADGIDVPTNARGEIVLRGPGALVRRQRPVRGRAVQPQGMQHAGLDVLAGRPRRG